MHDDQPDMMKYLPEDGWIYHIISIICTQEEIIYSGKQQTKECVNSFTNLLRQEKFLQGMKQFKWKILQSNYKGKKNVLLILWNEKFANFLKLFENVIKSGLDHRQTLNGKRNYKMARIVLRFWLSHNSSPSLPLSRSLHFIPLFKKQTTCIVWNKNFSIKSSSLDARILLWDFISWILSFNNR